MGTPGFEALPNSPSRKLPKRKVSFPNVFDWFLSSWLLFNLGVVEDKICLHDSGVCVEAETF